MYEWIGEYKAERGAQNIQSEDLVETRFCPLGCEDFEEVQSSALLLCFSDLLAFNS